MAASTKTDITTEQRRLLENYDPAIKEAGLADVLQDIIDVLNAHASEIDANTAEIATKADAT